MAQIVELDPKDLVSVANTRSEANEADVSDLASSIAEVGQQQAIKVRSINEAERKAIGSNGGSYAIIYGHRRARACRRLGITVKAEIVDIGARDAYLLTMLENGARKDTDPMEEARAFRRAMEEFNYTEEEIARAHGFRADVIANRLSLLRLNDDIKKLIADGQLGVKYGEAMADLNSNFQRIAMRHFNENDNPRIKWFRSVCGDLLSKQQQSGFSFFTEGGADDGKADDLQLDIPLKIETPDPDHYAPTFDPLNMGGSIAAELDKWRKAADRWDRFGYDRKAEASRAIVQTLRAMAEAIGSHTEAIETEGDRILRLLEERTEGGSMTTKQIMQYGNIASDDLAPILADLVNSGRIAQSRSGRGFRYSVNVNVAQ